MNSLKQVINNLKPESISSKQIETAVNIYKQFINT